MTMTAPTIITGLLLIGIGAFGYVNATPDAETGKVSPTALIPAGFGAVLTIFGLLVLAKPSLRKHVMHGAAAVGLFGFLGGFAPIIRGLSKTGSVDLSKPAVQNGLAMSMLCLIFVGLCVKSFIDARKAREKAEATPAS